MATSILRPPDLAKIGARLKRWQKQHDTPAKLAAAHRRVVLRRVVESMAFENEPVSMNRLKALLNIVKGKQRRQDRPVTSRPPRDRFPTGKSQSG